MATVFTHVLIPSATLASAMALPSIPDGCQSAILQAETAGVYYRRDAVSPDNTDADEEAQVLAAGASIQITQNIANVRVQCQAVGNNAKLRIAYQSSSG